MAETKHPEVNFPLIIKAGAVLVVLTVIVLAAVLITFRQLENREVRQDPKLSPVFSREQNSRPAAPSGGRTTRPEANEGQRGCYPEHLRLGRQGSRDRPRSGQRGNEADAGTAKNAGE